MCVCNGKKCRETDGICVLGIASITIKNKINKCNQNSIFDSHKKSTHKYRQLTNTAINQGVLRDLKNVASNLQVYV